MLPAIVGLSVVLRIGAALYLGDVITPQPGIFDEISYHTLSLRVLDGHGFSFGAGWWPATPANEPTAHWSFLYVLYLAGVYDVVGPHPLVARLLQAVIVGIGMPVLVYRITTRLFGERAALAAAATVAVYAYFVYYAAALLTEPFYIVALLTAVDTAFQIAVRETDERPALSLWVRLGVAFAAAVLLRQLILLILPVVLLWLSWTVNRRRRQAGRPSQGVMRQLLGPMVVTGIIAAAVLPWTLRNRRAFHEFALLNTNAGFAFFWGNHPMHGTTFVPLLPDGDAYRDLIPAPLLTLNEVQLDKALMARGFGFVAADPQRYLRLSLSRVREYVKFWPTEASGTASSYARALSFGVCLPFMVVGVGCAFRRTSERWATPQSGACAWLILLIAAEYSLIHIMTWTLVRYRLPVDALLMPFVGVAFASLQARMAGVPSLTVVAR